MRGAGNYHSGTMPMQDNAEPESASNRKRRLFRKAGKNSRRILLLALLVAATPSRLSLAIGLSLSLLSEMLIVLSYGMFTRKGNTRGKLVTDGPFAFLRNPVYLGYMLVGVGFSLAAGFEPLPLALGGLYLAVAIPNYIFRIRQEEKLLFNEFGEKYMDYKKKVKWRLLPSLLSGLLNGGFKLSWSLRLALENRSIAKTGKTLLWSLLFIAKWAVISEWLQKGRIRFWSYPDLLWWIITLAVSILIMIVPPFLRPCREADNVKASEN